MTIPRILLTSGEPAGIGPELIVQLVQENWPVELIVLADPTLLQQRAQQIGLPLRLIPFHADDRRESTGATTIKIIPVPLACPSQPGILDKRNAAYVITMLAQATQAALHKRVDAVVTAPVHKEILNTAGFDFLGHTEFFADQCGLTTPPLMLFVWETPTKPMRVALATTHLPLAQVPQALSATSLENNLQLLHRELMHRFKIIHPCILVSGLNPHAGEGGYLGHEEITIISPVIKKLSTEGYNLIGPLSADSLFTTEHLKQADAIVAMYHDQALPVVKYMSFGKAVNMTLGLPFIRTSVDHGTALALAGSGKADVGSLRAAVKLASLLVF